jgi:hypothetical protein
MPLRSAEIEQKIIHGRTLLYQTAPRNQSFSPLVFLLGPDFLWTLRMTEAMKQGKRKVPRMNVLKALAGWHRQGRRLWRWFHAYQGRHRQAALDDATHRTGDFAFAPGHEGDCLAWTSGNR